MFPNPIRSAKLLLQFVELLLKDIDCINEQTVANALTDIFHKVQRWIASHTVRQ